MPAEWYYTTNRQQMGPVSWEELQQLAERGLLKPLDLVWTDGMPEWVKAERQDGLFTYTESAPPPAPPTPRRADDEEEEDRSIARRSRRRDEDDDEDEGDERQRRRRKRRQKEGMAVGLKIGLAIGGGVILLLLLLCGGGMVLIGSGFGADTVPLTYSTTLQPGRVYDRYLSLKAGQRIHIVGTSNVDHPKTDVDVYVFASDNNDRPIARDSSIGPNSNIHFIAPVEGRYKVQVRNLGPGRATCRVTIN